MTNEDAIYVLRNTAWLGTIHDEQAVKKAVQMATEALKAQVNSIPIQLNRVKSDLISRQALFDALHYWFASPGFTEDRWWNSTHVLAAIEGVPSAESEIIQCNDCIHYKPMSNDSEWGYCSVHGNRTCQSIDFCAWAERRTDERHDIKGSG